MQLLSPTLRKPLALLGLTLGLLSAAEAHMPYLLPNTFDAGDRKHVSVIASFTENLFVPDVAMKSDHYAVITPGGERRAISTVHYLKDLAAFEVDTPDSGVYRITSGERLGRKAKAWRQADGNWKFVDERGTAPQDVKIVEVQSVTTADVYVTRGKANRTALAPTGKGVEIALQSLPLDIVARQPVQADLLFEGKALPNVAVDFFRGSLEGTEEKPLMTVRSDARGKLVFSLPEGGTYLALVRHRTESPVGAETPWRSYSYTLTFAVDE